MYEPIKKKQDDKSQVTIQKSNNQKQGVGFVDKRQSTITQRMLQNRFLSPINTKDTPIQLLPDPKEAPFMTKEELEKELAKTASLTEIYNFYMALRQLHKGEKSMPAHLEIVENYLNTEYKKIIKIVHDFKENTGYTSNYKPFIHNLFGNVTMTLYPVEGKNPDKDKGSARLKVHRPVLDIEIVGRQPYARCYIGLYGPAGETDFKDVTSDKAGNITLKDIGLMNLGNPFKALLWAEDYLTSQEHYQNSSTGKPAPRPVVRSFLVPLEDAQGMIMRYGKYKDVRPLDQDRGSGQFGHISNEHLYSELLSPLIGSLVSFFHDPDDFDEAPDVGQQKYGLVDLQEFLTGHREDVRKIATEGIAAQHNRFGHEAQFDKKYEGVMDAYYRSVDTDETGFTGGTRGTAPDFRRSIIDNVLSRFPRVSSLVSSMEESGLGSSEGSMTSSTKKLPVSLVRLRTFLEAYADLDVVVEEEDEEIVEEVDSSGTEDLESTSTEQTKKQPSSGSSKKKVVPKSSSKVEKSDLKNQYASFGGGGGPVIAHNWFNVTRNSGGGDCLFHALEGRNLDGQEVLDIREQVAGIRDQQPDTEGGSAYNANVVAATITQTPSLLGFAPMVMGRQAVPNRVLAMMQAIPGVYAGTEELLQWVRLRDQDVIVIDRDGSVTRYRTGGTQVLFNLRNARSARILTIIRGIAENARVVLYKSLNHWERITGVTDNFPEE